MYVYVCAHISLCPWRAEEVVKSPGARVTGFTELLNISIRN